MTPPRKKWIERSAAPLSRALAVAGPRSALALSVLTLSVLTLAVLIRSAEAQSSDPIATDTPTATIESLNSGLVAAARDHPGAAIGERYGALEPVITQTHDLPYIAEFALRRQWDSLSEEQRARFVAAFEKLSVTTYASRFVNVTPATFRPVAAQAPDATAAETRARVTTAIARPGQSDVPLEYLLERKGGAWRIINIVADGVSDLALKRAEYQRVLASGSIDDLIAHLERQTAELERP